MLHSHQPLFVLLSLLVAVVGSWTALDLFRRVRSHIGRTRRVWLGTAALAMGLSIWSMHFIAMLGFDPGSPVRYDPALTFLSLVLAVAGTWGAFFSAAGETATTRRLLVSGLAMGIGICLMHYVGMAALRTAVSLGYRPGLVLLSFGVAVGASTAALYAARRERALAWRLAAAAGLGAAIVGMHYTAMAALQITSPEGHVPPALPGAPPIAIAAGVAGGALLILFLALLASLYDQRLNVLAALEAAGVGYWEVSLPGMELHVSARGKEIFGRRADQPFTHADFLQALGPEQATARSRNLTTALERRGEYDGEYRMQTSPDDPRWVNIRGRVVAASGGRPRRMAGVVLDVTDRREAFIALAAAEARQRLLIGELNHRVKNTLATVQSMARQTAKRAGSIEDFRSAFDARLVALSQTHNALTRGAWEGASLRQLVEQELRPFAKEQVRVSGVDTRLSPRAALAIGMVLHELATNAAKYGALSSPSGCVSVRWRLLGAGEARQLLLRWGERGGPTVSAPAKRGFGSRLIDGSARELGGAIRTRFAPRGVVCTFRFPVSGVVAIPSMRSDAAPSDFALTADFSSR